MKSPRSMVILAAVACLGFYGCQPDLEVNLTANGSYSVGEDVAGTVDAKVSNTGNAAAPGTDAGYMVDLVLSQDNVVPVAAAAVPNPYNFQEDMLLQGGRISNTDTLAASATKVYSGHGGPIPPGTPSPVFLCAVVDPLARVAEKNEANNTFCTQVDITSGERCVTFETPAIGTEYGTPAGQSPGDLALVANGIRVTVENFLWTNGGGAFGSARVVASSPAFGVDAQYLGVNNINVEFDFTGLPFTPSAVTFFFRDQGGNENLSINGDPAPVFAGELTAAPTPLGGVSFVTAPPSATLTGSVERLRVGGQEFSLDQVCARP